MKKISFFTKLDWKFIFIILLLMGISLLIISSMDPAESGANYSSKTFVQMHHFALGWVVFFLCACFDYIKLKKCAFILYILGIICLFGLFFAPTIQNVHRWYRIPFIKLSLQPSEYVKLITVITLSWFLERRSDSCNSLRVSLIALFIVFVPFILILKQPDLGTALILWPIALVIFYLGNINKFLVRIIGVIGLVSIVFTLSIFLNILPFEKMRPWITLVLKEYQYERLNPLNHHQWASVTAIGVGGVKGLGWKSGIFAGRGWLPYSCTDSVFSAFGEEFGFLGLSGLLLLFYGLIFLSCRITAVAKDEFGKFLASGITVYIAMHVLINISMMCALLPVTGLPLLLVSYGGSSVITTMAALGLLQSIYIRRHVF